MFLYFVGPQFACRNDCHFVAYNPLAAGLLTGKHLSNSNEEVREGRFRNNPNYMPRYYTSSNFTALDLIRSACQPYDVSLVDATYRWLIHHSALGDNDGILIGASSLSQLDENLRCCRHADADAVEGGGGGGGRLPQRLVDAIDEAWTAISSTARDDGGANGSGPFPYWRSYSSDMPGREDLDQGASYDALKAK